MKKNYTTKIVMAIAFLFSFISYGSKAQMYYLPDTNFRNALISLGYSSCIANDSIDSNCLGANDTVLNVTNRSIQSLEGVQAFSFLTQLNCAMNQLTSLPALPVSLTFLNCHTNNLTSLPLLPASLTYLICSSNQLNALPVLPSSLTELQCYSNQLTSLPVLPASLINIMCLGNLLDSLPALPPSLVSLNCSGNQLTSLPVLPNSVTDLNCNMNQLAGLPALPASLMSLDCSNNQLTNLPVLPSSLTNLNCSNNPLVGLPSLPASLTTIASQYDHLISLPVLPSMLEIFSCAGNQLTNLPALPVTLTSLVCGYNQLTSLPVFPPAITNIQCQYNQLTSIPALPASVKNLICNNNLLTSLPDLPDSMNVLHCMSNWNLTCFPRLNQISNLFFVFTGITCLPNYGNVTHSNPLLNSFPLCDLFNPHGCSFSWNIDGRSYFDTDTNCNFDLGDVGIRNAHILLYRNGNLEQQVFTNHIGFYSFDQLDTGNYIVQYDSSSLQLDLECPLNGAYNDTITQIDSLFYNNDFAFKCKPGFDVGVHSIMGRFRPAHYSFVHIGAGDMGNFFGAHCAGGVGGTVVISFSGPVSYIGPDSSALAPTMVSGNALTYNISDFGTVNFFSGFNFILLTDTNAALGSSVCITVIVSASGPGDFNSSNDTLSHCFLVRNSFDPNEKEVSPQTDVDINGNQWLTYTIHFQNTGTAPAEHIYITDTLDSNLDLSTFELLAYSHEPFVQILPGRVAKFNFPNINLPDSNANEPGSHGYIQYRIKLNSGLTVGTQVHNTAYIYFDFNAPVVTNTTENTLQLITHIPSNSQSDLQVSVYPNPSRGEFTVYCSQFPAGRKVLLKLYDALGNELLNEKMTTSNFTLHTSQFPAGIYFLKVMTDQGTVMKKLVRN